jgi:hypothetical protein
MTTTQHAALMRLADAELAARLLALANTGEFFPADCQEAFVVREAARRLTLPAYDSIHPDAVRRNELTRTWRALGCPAHEYTGPWEDCCTTCAGGPGAIQHTANPAASPHIP